MPCHLCLQLLTSFMPNILQRDISKQCRHSSDATEVASDECLCGLHLHLIYNSLCKNDKPDTPKMNGIVQIVRLEESTRQKWV